MPITVKHGPDLRLLGAGGMLAGYGDFTKDEIAIQQRDRALALQAAEQAEQARRTNAGIFHDQQQLGQRAYQFKAGQQHDFDMSEDRFQQQAALAEFDLAKRQELQQAQFGQQQQLQDQQLQSNEEIKFQDAEVAYQNRVATAERDGMIWSPAQERQRRSIEEAIRREQNNPHHDKGQKAYGVRALKNKLWNEVGPPSDRKQIPTIDEQFATGQSKWITDPETGARAIASFDRNGAPRFAFVPDKQAQSRQEQDRTYDAKVKDWDRQIKYQTERRTWINERAQQLAEPDFEGKPAMPFVDARRQAEQEVDRVIPPPPPMPAGPVPGQPSIGPQPQSRGLPPIPQEWLEWQAGMQPQQGPQPQGPVQQQSSPQPQSAGTQNAKSVVITSSSGKQYSLQQIRDLANKLGVPIEKVLQDFGVNPQELGM